MGVIIRIVYFDMNDTLFDFKDVFLPALSLLERRVRPNEGDKRVGNVKSQIITLRSPISPATIQVLFAHD